MFDFLLSANYCCENVDIAAINSKKPTEYVRFLFEKQQHLCQSYGFMHDLIERACVCVFESIGL